MKINVKSIPEVEKDIERIIIDSKHKRGRANPKKQRPVSEDAGPNLDGVSFEPARYRGGPAIVSCGVKSRFHHLADDADSRVAFCGRESGGAVDVEVKNICRRCVAIYERRHKSGILDPFCVFGDEYFGDA